MQANCNQITCDMVRGVVPYVELVLTNCLVLL